MKKMGNNRAEIFICLILLISCGFLILIIKSGKTEEIFANVDPEYNWIVHGIVNMFGYLTVLVPGYLIFKYISKIKYLDKQSNTILVRLMRCCFQDDDVIECSTTRSTPRQNSTQRCMLLLYYAMGLQVSYISWGVLQEKVMTQEYRNSVNEIGRFKDTQFLVFVNRIVAFCMSAMVILCKRQSRHKCPMYKYVFCSLSNIMSSWCQYEALKYVSFPHQVLAKAAKIIPVMIMGKIVSKTKYAYYEYATAGILSTGMLFFMLDAGNDNGNSTSTISGVILLCSYIAFDSFTSNWQGSLFQQYNISPIQMMCAVNLFSCTFTAISLLQQGSFIISINFMTQFPSFTFDCFLLSVCSAVGQLFIFATLATFGPVIFAIISTIRQGFSVLLSCIIYNHKMHALGIFGIILVFFSILFRIYCGHRIKIARKNVEILHVLKK